MTWREQGYLQLAFHATGFVLGVRAGGWVGGWLSGLCLGLTICVCIALIMHSRGEIIR